MGGDRKEKTKEQTDAERRHRREQRKADNCSKPSSSSSEKPSSSEKVVTEEEIVATITGQMMPPTRDEIKQSDHKKSFRTRGARSRPKQVLPDTTSSSKTDESKKLHLKRTTVSGQIPRKEPPRDRMGRTKSDGLNFKPPRMLDEFCETQTGKQPARKQRSRSLDDDQFLLEMQFESPPMPLGTPLNGAEGPIQDHVPAAANAVALKSSSCEIGVIIEPTGQQKQLMRKVSALGLEDPVFGNVDNQLRPRHASMLFDDMDFADVPKDMRDILSVVSDHTDEVVVDKRCFVNQPAKICNDGEFTESPHPEPMGTKETAPLTTSSHNIPREEEESLVFPPQQVSSRAMGANFVPPAGSFIQRAVRESHDGPELEIGFQPPKMAPPAPAPRSNQSSAKNISTISRSRPTNAPIGSDPQPPNSYSYASFIPPSGSFNKRAPSRSASGSSQRDRGSVLKDIAIKAQNIAIEAQVEALFSESNKDKNIESLSASFSNLNDSISSFNESFNNGAFVPKLVSHRAFGSNAKSSPLSKPKPTRSHSNPHEGYFPPSAPGLSSQTNKNEHRALPSMTALFSGSPMKKLAPTSIQQKAHTSSGSLNLDFLRETPSEKPTKEVFDPLWASLAALEDPSKHIKKPPRDHNGTKASSHSKVSKVSGSDGSSKGKLRRRHKAGHRRTNSHSKKDVAAKQENWLPDSTTPVLS